MANWKKVAAGYYKATRDGADVAVIERIKDHGEPVWDLLIFDGTQLRKSSKGNVFTHFCTLADAKFAYNHARRTARA